MLCETHHRVNLAATSHREGTTASAAPSRRRSGRSGARLAWGEAGTLPGVAEGNGKKLGTLLTSWNNCEPGSLKWQMGIASLPRDLRYGDPTVCD